MSNNNITRINRLSLIPFYENRKFINGKYKETVDTNNISGVIRSYFKYVKKNILNGHEHTVPYDYFSFCIKRKQLNLSGIKKQKEGLRLKFKKEMTYHRIGYTYKIECYGWLLDELGLKFKPTSVIKHDLFKILTQTDKEYRDVN